MRTEELSYSCAPCGYHAKCWQDLRKHCQQSQRHAQRIQQLGLADEVRQAAPASYKERKSLPATLNNAATTSYVDTLNSVVNSGVLLPNGVQFPNNDKPSSSTTLPFAPKTKSSSHPAPPSSVNSSSSSLNPNSIACCVCGQIFDSGEEIHAHIAIEHVRYFAYECNQCKYGMFPTDFALRRHYVDVHGKADFKITYSVSPEDDSRRALVSVLMLASMRGEKLNLETALLKNEHNFLGQVQIIAGRPKVFGVPESVQQYSASVSSSSIEPRPMMNGVHKEDDQQQLVDDGEMPELCIEEDEPPSTASAISPSALLAQELEKKRNNVTAILPVNSPVTVSVNPGMAMTEEEIVENPFEDAIEQQVEIYAAEQPQEQQPVQSCSGYLAVGGSQILQRAPLLTGMLSRPPLPLQEPEIIALENPDMRDAARQLTACYRAGVMAMPTKQVLQCTLCKLDVCDDRLSMKQHILREHNTQAFGGMALCICRICNKEFNSVTRSYRNAFEHLGRAHGKTSSVFIIDNRGRILPALDSLMSMLFPSTSDGQFLQLTLHDEQRKLAAVKLRRKMLAANPRNDAMEISAVSLLQQPTTLSESLENEQESIFDEPSEAMAIDVDDDVNIVENLENPTESMHNSWSREPGFASVNQLLQDALTAFSNPTEGTLSSTSTAQKQPRQWHNRAKRYYCVPCNLAFNSRQLLSDHQRTPAHKAMLKIDDGHEPTVSGSKYARCMDRHCNRSKRWVVNTAEAIEQHIMSFHVPEDKRDARCSAPDCGRRFMDPTECQEHVNYAHAGEMSYFVDAREDLIEEIKRKKWECFGLGEASETAEEPMVSPSQENSRPCNWGALKLKLTPKQQAIVDTSPMVAIQRIPDSFLDTRENMRVYLQLLSATDAAPFPAQLPGQFLPSPSVREKEAHSNGIHPIVVSGPIETHQKVTAAPSIHGFQLPRSPAFKLSEYLQRRKQGNDALRRFREREKRHRETLFTVAERLESRNRALRAMVARLETEKVQLSQLLTIRQEEQTVGI